MATYNVTVSHGLFLDDAQEALNHLIDVVVSLADDLDYTDGRVAIAVIRNGAMVEDALSGSLQVTSQTVDLVRAIREFPSQREIDQSNGKIRIGDRKFHYQANDASFEPRIGDLVRFNGTQFEIVAVDIQTLGTRYLVWCRA